MTTDERRQSIASLINQLSNELYDMKTQLDGQSTADSNNEVEVFWGELATEREAHKETARVLSKTQDALSKHWVRMLVYRIDSLNLRPTKTRVVHYTLNF